MTKQDKRDLRRLILTGSKSSDEDLAYRCHCKVGTVRKYRRALAPEPRNG